MIRSPPAPSDTLSLEDTETAVMVRNGITRIPAHYYHVDGYRYTSLADALAQVRRGSYDRSLSS